MKLSKSELATIFAALQFWKDEMGPHPHSGCYPEYFVGMPALTSEQIDGLRTKLTLYGTQMSDHDRIRMEQALECDRDNEGSVRNAVRGLQSTDSPALVPLHEELMARLLQLEAMPKLIRFYFALALDECEHCHALLDARKAVRVNGAFDACASELGDRVLYRADNLNRVYLDDPEPNICCNNCGNKVPFNRYDKG